MGFGPGRLELEGEGLGCVASGVLWFRVSKALR